MFFALVFYRLIIHIFIFTSTLIFFWVYFEKIHGYTLITLIFIYFSIVERSNCSRIVPKHLLVFII